MSSQNHEKTVTVQLGQKIKKYPVKEKKLFDMSTQNDKKETVTVHLKIQKPTLTLRERDEGGK